MWILMSLKNIKHFLMHKPIMFMFIIVSQVLCVITVMVVAGMIYAVTPDPKDERGFFDKMFIITLEHFDNSEDDEDKQNMYYYLMDMSTNKFIYTGTDGQKVNDIEKEYYERGIKEAEEYGKIIHSVSKYAISVPANFSSLPQYGKIKEKIANIIIAASDDVYKFYINGYIGDSVDMSFTSEYALSEYMKNSNDPLLSASNGIKVRKNQYANTPYKNIMLNNNIEIGGSEFTVVELEEQEIGLGQTTFCFLMNNTSDDFKISTICLAVKDTTTLEQLEKIQTTINREFGGVAEIEVPKPMPLLEKQFNNMIYVVSAIILVVVLLNVMRFYAFVLSSRKRSMLVFSICGAGKLKLFIIAVFEIVLTVVLSFTLGILMFHTLLIPLISGLYPSFGDIFNIRMYALFFGVYSLTGVIIMILNILPLFIGNNISERKN